LRLLERLEDGEAEADQCKRGADHRHQRSVGTHASSLERHAGPAARQLGGDVLRHFTPWKVPRSASPRNTISTASATCITARTAPTSRRPNSTAPCMTAWAKSITSRLSTIT